MRPDGYEWMQPVTKDCFADGKRPLLEGEKMEPVTDEFYFLLNGWTIINESAAWKPGIRWRTSRPLPAASELVALERSDIQRGSWIREIGEVSKYAIHRIDGSGVLTKYTGWISFQRMKEGYEIIGPNSEEWMSCSKPKTS